MIHVSGEEGAGPLLVLGWEEEVVPPYNPKRGVSIGDNSCPQEIAFGKTLKRALMPSSGESQNVF